MGIFKTVLKKVALAATVIAGKRLVSKILSDVEAKVATEPVKSEKPKTAAKPVAAKKAPAKKPAAVKKAPVKAATAKPAAKPKATTTKAAAKPKATTATKPKPAAKPKAARKPKVAKKPEAPAAVEPAKTEAS